MSSQPHRRSRGRVISSSDEDEREGTGTGGQPGSPTQASQSQSQRPPDSQFESQQQWSQTEWAESQFHQDQDDDEEESQSQSQEPQPSHSRHSHSHSHSRKSRSSHHRRDSSESVDPDLQSQYMFDDQTIIAAARSRNVRQQLYSGLIQGAQGFQDRDGTGGFDLRTVLTENTLKGKQLGDIDLKTAQSLDLFNAIKHTNLCTRMLRFQSEKVGDTKTFRADDYIEALKRMGNKIRHCLVKVYAKSAAIGIPQYNLVGTFNREPVVPKTKTPRTVTRRKRIFDEDMSQATQHDEDGDDGSQRSGGGGGPTNQAERITSNLFRTLKHKTRERPNLNFFEFTVDQDSMAQTIENVFYTGFLARDGHASLTASDPRCDCVGDMLVKPDKPPKKNAAAGPGNQQQVAKRNQQIVSFSSKLYQELLAAANGETEITPVPKDAESVPSSVKKPITIKTRPTKRLTAVTESDAE